MKSKIFLYLFLFAVLFIIFQYMNEKKIFEAQEKQIENLSETVKTQNDSIASLQDTIFELGYFSLQGNENAMTYLENYGYDSQEVEALVSNEIHNQNSIEADNPFVPFQGMNNTMKINKIKFLNHKWIQADFTDGTYWGEVLMEYNLNEKNELTLHTIASLLYPSN